MKKSFFYVIVFSVAFIMASGQICAWYIHVYPNDKIQEAIDEAIDGCVIIIHDGVYKGAGNRNLDFNGKAIHVRSSNGPNNCIIDCEGIGRAVYFHDGEGSDTILEGITIRNGYSYDYGHGGGIYIHSSSPTIRNVRIYNCDANEYGGGIAVDGSSLPQIVDCRIESCEAYNGGGLSLRSSLSNNITVENCYIRNDRASHFGGGIFIDTRKPTIKDCNIYDNVSEHHGGGVWLYNADFAEFFNTWVVHNRSERSGGGIHIYICDSVKMKNTVFYMNEAVNHGGGVYIRREIPTLAYFWFESGYIFSNTADEGGGIAASTNVWVLLFSTSLVSNANYAIWKNPSSTAPNPWIINCTFNGNQPEDFNY